MERSEYEIIDNFLLNPFQIYLKIYFSVYDVAENKSVAERYLLSLLKVNIYIEVEFVL